MLVANVKAFSADLGYAPSVSKIAFINLVKNWLKLGLKDKLIAISISNRDSTDSIKKKVRMLDNLIGQKKFRGSGKYVWPFFLLTFSRLNDPSIVKKISRVTNNNP